MDSVVFFEMSPILHDAQLSATQWSIHWAATQGIHDFAFGGYNAKGNSLGSCQSLPYTS
jgi:hypothetical protein